ncbi:MAG: amidohydrolase family protein, partial [Pseudomonadota bacterium]
PWLTRVYLEGVPDEYQILVSNPSDARRKTLELIDRGAQVIKTWVGLTKEDYQAIVDAAHSRNIKVHAHLYHPKAIQDAIDTGVDVFQHVGSARNPLYPPELVAQITHRGIPIVQTISHRIWVYPRTKSFPSRLDNAFLEQDIPSDIYRELQESFKQFHRLSYFSEIGLETRNSKQSARQFIDANAVMGVGTDAASPLNFHTEAIWIELGALVDSGMTPIQAISAATKTNAEILDHFETLGTIEPGKLADLIVVDGNVLTQMGDIPRVEIVVKDGRLWHQLKQPDDNLQTIAQPL